MKTTFNVFSVGDDSVGIWGLTGTVVIEDNCGEHDSVFIEGWREKIKEMYPDEHGLTIVTEEEYQEQMRIEEELFGYKEDNTKEEI